MLNFESSETADFRFQALLRSDWLDFCKTEKGEILNLADQKGQDKNGRSNSCPQTTAARSRHFR